MSIKGATDSVWISGTSKTDREIVFKVVESFERIWWMFGCSFQKNKNAQTHDISIPFHDVFSDPTKSVDGKLKLPVFEVIQKSFRTGSGWEERVGFCEFSTYRVNAVYTYAPQ